MSRGYVYVLSNPSIPGLVKVGRSANGGPARAKELSRATGVAQPFVLEFEILADDARHVEGAAHELLTDRRSNANREFFACDVVEAREAVVCATLGAPLPERSAAGFVSRIDYEREAAVADALLAALAHALADNIYRPTPWDRDSLAGLPKTLQDDVRRAREGNEDAQRAARPAEVSAAQRARGIYKLQGLMDLLDQEAVR